MLLTLVRNAAWILPVAAVFGLGMGLCVPPLNSLMYLVTEPKHRGFNANMMMLSIHFGTFLGGSLRGPRACRAGRVRRRSLLAVCRRGPSHCGLRLRFG